jgi:anti-sigma B factor antagonist
VLLQVERTEDPRGFRLVGELDVSNIERLNAALEPDLQDGGTVTLDLAGLAFMDSSGIQALIQAARTLGDRGRLVVRSPGRIVRRLLDLIPVSRLENVDVLEDGE